jgi:hypothetical protein
LAIADVAEANLVFELGAQPKKQAAKQSKKPRSPKPSAQKSQSQRRPASERGSS